MDIFEWDGICYLTQISSLPLSLLFNQIKISLKYYIHIILYNRVESRGKFASFWIFLGCLPDRAKIFWSSFWILFNKFTCETPQTIPFECVYLRIQYRKKIKVWPISNVLVVKKSWRVIVGMARIWCSLLFSNKILLAPE